MCDVSMCQFNTFVMYHISMIDGYTCAMFISFYFISFIYASVVSYINSTHSRSIIYQFNTCAVYHGIGGGSQWNGQGNWGVNPSQPPVISNPAHCCILARVLLHTSYILAHVQMLRYLLTYLPSSRCVMFRSTTRPIIIVS